MQLDNGADVLLELALQHCGLTLERIREFHLLRFSLINPVINIVDRCVGVQWCGLENFWNGTSNAPDLTADPSDMLFYLIIYGELFGPDMEAFLDPESQANTLEFVTRIDFTEGCVAYRGDNFLGHVLKSSRWKSYWKEMRALAGPYFSENFSDEWAFSDDSPGDWRQVVGECDALPGAERVGDDAATSEEFVGGQSQIVERSDCELDRGARNGQVV
jgi:hypothetical protein